MVKAPLECITYNGLGPPSLGLGDGGAGGYPSSTRLAKAGEPRQGWLEAEGVHTAWHRRMPRLMQPTAVAKRRQTMVIITWGLEIGNPTRHPDLPEAVSARGPFEGIWEQADGFYYCAVALRRHGQPASQPASPDMTHARLLAFGIRTRGARLRAQRNMIVAGP